MKGASGGIQTLIINECPSTHSIHCFIHQLQLTLVALEIESWLSLAKALSFNELMNGCGLNQELILINLDDTR